jgi:hypothetical protein
LPRSHDGAVRGVERQRRCLPPIERAAFHATMHLDFVRALDDPIADLSVIEAPYNRHSYALERLDGGIQLADVGSMAVAGIDARQRVCDRRIDADHTVPRRVPHDQPVPVCRRA